MEHVPNRANHPKRSNLYGLLAEAKKHDTFESFEKSWFRGLQGRYYHLTDNPQFTINPQTGPRDTLSTVVGNPDVGALMVTSTPNVWHENYEGTRPYAAIIDLSASPKDSYYETTRGYGHETYVTPEGAKYAKVEQVLPIEQALKDASRYRKTIPQSRQELQALYESVKRGN